LKDEELEENRRILEGDEELREKGFSVVVCVKCASVICEMNLYTLGCMQNDNRKRV
jgi:hypothetical protein